MFSFCYTRLILVNADQADEVQPLPDKNGLNGNKIVQPTICFMMRVF